MFSGPPHSTEWWEAGQGPVNKANEGCLGHWQVSLQCMFPTLFSLPLVTYSPPSRACSPPPSSSCSQSPSLDSETPWRKRWGRNKWDPLLAFSREVWSINCSYLHHITTLLLAETSEAGWAVQQPAAIPQKVGNDTFAQLLLETIIKNSHTKMLLLRFVHSCWSVT